MTRSPKKNRRKTASAPSNGGCFSVSLAPLAVMVFAAFFMLAAGETSDPVTMARAAPAQPQSAPASTPISPLFTPEVQYWADSIKRWADEWDLDPNLVATIMQIESCGDPLAQSHAGALGLFQVMPYHFQAGDNPQTPDTNARRGLAYLRNSLDTHLSARLALAGYNGGISTAGKSEAFWPAETLRYVYWGDNIYKDAQRGQDHSITLQEWLGKGGASLCAQASWRLGLTP